jgi:hypothetical protein
VVASFSGNYEIAEEPQTRHHRKVMEAERNVDHAGIVIELLTKSYERFKNQKSGRVALYIAGEIARLYYNTEKYEMVFLKTLNLGHEILHAD